MQLVEKKVQLVGNISGGSRSQKH